jgi:hypothetical protein
MTESLDSIDQRRRQELVFRGFSKTDIETLMDYGRHPYSLDTLQPPIQIPMLDEPHVTAWRFLESINPEDLFGELQKFLPQLSIPIRHGISKTELYSDVVRRGKPFSLESFGDRLTIQEPTALKLQIRNHYAGALPVLTTSNRSDFESLVRATVGRSEPIMIRNSINAQFVIGINNWSRLQSYYNSFITRSHSGRSDWTDEIRRISTYEKWRFQDRLILLCEAPYSGLSVEAIEKDMIEDEWLVASTELRCEHEFIHYLTLRLFGSTRLHLHDELICDWAGVVASLHNFKGAWLKAFLGLSSDSTLNEGARFFAYSQGISTSVLPSLCQLTCAAIDGLEMLHREYYSESEHLHFLLTTLGMSLEELASQDSASRFVALQAKTRELLSFEPSVTSEKAT